MAGRTMTIDRLLDMSEQLSTADRLRLISLLSDRLRHEIRPEDEVVDILSTVSLRALPREACALVDGAIVDNAYLICGVRPVRNRCRSRHAFGISNDDLCWPPNAVRAVFHSHPGPSTPSTDDMSLFSLRFDLSFQLIGPGLDTVTLLQIAESL